MDTTALEQHYKIMGLNIWRMNPQSCLDTLPGGNPQGVAMTGALRTAMNQQFKELEHKGPIFLPDNREGGASVLVGPGQWLPISGGSLTEGGSLSLNQDAHGT